MLILSAFSTARAELHYGQAPTTVTEEDADAAWENFKEIGLTPEYTQQPDRMLRALMPLGYGLSTAGEFQAWALILAVMHDEPETAQKLWNFSKQYIPEQRRGLVPWLIKQDPNKFAGSNVADADYDYAIALDMAARKWPDFRFTGDDTEKMGELANLSWGEWAEYYIDRIYDTMRAKNTNPESPNAITGKGYDTSRKAYAGGRDEHYYLHYSPYGYFKNWTDRTGEPNWLEPVGELESVYEAEIALQRPTLQKYYGVAEVDLYCWPPHQVRKDGMLADDLINKYDSGATNFNWGAGRITARANHAYTNYGDAHAEKMMRFIADRFWEETGGDPAKIRKGYRVNTVDGKAKGCGGWGDPDILHVGHAALASMVDEQYADMRDRMALALAEADTSDDPSRALGQAYYLLHMTGGMDFRIEE